MRRVLAVGLVVVVLAGAVAQFAPPITLPPAIPVPPPLVPVAAVWYVGGLIVGGVLAWLYQHLEGGAVSPVSVEFEADEVVGELPSPGVGISTAELEALVAQMVIDGGTVASDPFSVAGRLRVAEAFQPEAWLSFWAEFHPDWILGAQDIMYPMWYYPAVDLTVHPGMAVEDMVNYSAHYGRLIISAGGVDGEWLRDLSAVSLLTHGIWPANMWSEGDEVSMLWVPSVFLEGWGTVYEYTTGVVRLGPGIEEWLERTSELVDYLDGLPEDTGRLGDYTVPGAQIVNRPHYLATWVWPYGNWVEYSRGTIVIPDQSALMSWDDYRVSVDLPWHQRLEGTVPVPVRTWEPMVMWSVDVIPFAAEYTLDWGDMICPPGAPDGPPNGMPSWLPGFAWAQGEGNGLLAEGVICPGAGWLAPAQMMVRTAVPVVTRHVLIDPEYGPHYSSVYQVQETVSGPGVVYVQLVLPRAEIGFDGVRVPYDVWVDVVPVASGAEVGAVLGLYEQFWRAVWLDVATGFRTPEVVVAVGDLTLPWDVEGAADEGWAVRKVDQAPVLWIVRPLEALEAAFTPKKGIGERVEGLIARLRTRFPFALAGALVFGGAGQVPDGPLEFQSVEYGGMVIAPDNAWANELGGVIRLAVSVLLVVLLLVWVRSKLMAKVVA